MTMTSAVRDRVRRPVDPDEQDETGETPDDTRGYGIGADELRARFNLCRAGAVL